MMWHDLVVIHTCFRYDQEEKIPTTANVAIYISENGKKKSGSPILIIYKDINELIVSRKLRLGASSRAPK